MIPLRLYIYAGIALAFVSLFIHDRWTAKRYEHQKAANVTLTATINAERENTRKANEASNAYQADLRRLEDERSNTPVVRLCKPARVRPAATTAGSDAEAAGHVGGEAAENLVAGPDIGADLLEYGIACEANMLQLDRLQGWIRNR